MDGTVGDFNQEGDRIAFASSENFGLPLWAAGRKPTLTMWDTPRFANIDSDHCGVKMEDRPLVFVANMGISSGKIGKKLSKNELKAGLDALWDDGGWKVLWRR